MGDIYHAGNTFAGSVPIDDTQTTATNTWSAQKINDDRPLITGELDLAANASASTPQSISVTGATADMAVTNFYLKDPSKVTSNSISFNVTDGAVAVTAVVSAATKIMLHLEKVRTS